MLAMMWPERDGWTIVCQHPLDPYRIDIAVPEAKVAVEVNSFGAHGSAAAMAHDAKRRTVLSLQGWETVELPSQEVFLFAYRLLAERVLPIVKRRLSPAYQPPMPRPSGKAKPPLDTAETAAHGKALLAALEAQTSDNWPSVVLGPSQRELANRGTTELAGIRLLNVVLTSPRLAHDPGIAAALTAIDGPVSLAAAALRKSMIADVIDKAAFLRACPALLQPFAASCLREPACDNDDDAMASARAILATLGGA
jgi:very-short-patch-repair endonuclease